MIDESKNAADIKALKAEFMELTRQIQSIYATKAYVQMYTEQMLGDTIPVHDPYTENTFISGYTPLDIERVLKHFQNIKSTYTLYDYRKILIAYDDAAKLGNINPYIAVSQMVKETDWCRSFWSQRPRRNPAGIGVTGEKSTEEKLKDTWAFDSSEGVWKKGYSFPSWEISAQAHIGHLLAYLYKHDSLKPEYIALIAVDPRAKFIANNIRGSVKILKDLEGRWVVPGIGYGKSIAIIANALRT